MPEDPDKPDDLTPPDPSDGTAATGSTECGKYPPAAGSTKFCYPAPDPFRLEVLNDQDTPWGY